MYPNFGEIMISGSRPDFLAQEGSSLESVDATIQSILGPFSDWLNKVVFYAPSVGGVEIPLIVVWLMAGAIFLTVYFRFQPFTGLKYSYKVVQGRLTRKTDPGQVSSFQALATELSGTVGLGNIAGVAVAITIGGPGAVLWIIIFGFLAMTMKMVEATLGVKYREVDDKGEVIGGPMYYLRNGLREKGMPGFGSFLGYFYAIATLVGVFGAGNLFQANQVAMLVQNATGGEESFFAGRLWIIGLIMAILAGIVILGGISRIAQWTSAITPLMGVMYVACVLIILVINVQHLPGAVGAIFTGAFTGEGVTGGIVGVAIVGIQRALFSNVGGVGTAGMAHAAVKTRHPATEGFTALWEPFVDSVVVCTLTGLAITITGVYQGDASGDGIVLTTEAFATVSSWFPIFVTVAAILFGFSTVLSYAYYGEVAIGFLTKKSRAAVRGFHIVWILAVVVGSAMTLESVVGISDATLFIMAFPNLLGIYFLARRTKKEIWTYRARVKAGTLDEIPEDLQVGLRDHEPTQQQIKEEDARLKAEGEKQSRVRRAFRKITADRREGREDKHTKL